MLDASNEVLKIETVHFLGSSSEFCLIREVVFVDGCQIVFPDNAATSQKFSFQETELHASLTKQCNLCSTA